MATRQRLGFALSASTPNRADRVDDVFRSQSSSRSGNRVAGRQSTLAGDNFFASFQNRRASGAMDRAVHAASTHQRGVRSIHDGIASLARDVARSGDDQRTPRGDEDAYRLGRVCHAIQQLDSFAVGEILRIKILLSMAADEMMPEPSR